MNVNFVYNKVSIFNKNINRDILSLYKETKNTKEGIKHTVNPLYLAFYDKKVDVLKNILFNDFLSSFKDNLVSKLNTEERNNFFNLLYANIRKTDNKEIVDLWVEYLKDILTYEEKVAFISCFLLKGYQDTLRLNDISQNLEVNLTEKKLLDTIISNYKENHVHSIGEYRIAGKNRVSITLSMDFLLDKLNKNDYVQMLEKIKDFFMKEELNDDFIYYSYIKNNKKISNDLTVKILEWCKKRKTKYPEEMLEIFSSGKISEEDITKYLLNSTALLDINIDYATSSYPYFFKKLENMESIIDNTPQKSFRLSINDKIFDLFLENIESKKDFFNMIGKMEKKKSLELNDTGYEKIAKKIIPDFNSKDKDLKLVKHMISAYIEKNNLIDSLSDNIKENTYKRRI